MGRIATVVTMAGNSMVSRVAGSALKNIGMEELITYNLGVL